MTLSEVLVLPLMLMRLTSTSRPGLMVKVILTLRRDGSSAVFGSHVDEGVAAIGIKIRQGQHVMLQRRAAEVAPGLMVISGVEFAARIFQVAGDIDARRPCRSVPRRSGSSP